MDGAEIFDWKVVGSGGENVNESRKRSMERRNEYEINSIPPSAAWRNSMHLYALAGKASFCFPVYRLFSPRSRLPCPPPHSFHFPRPLAISFHPPSSVIFLNDFSRVLSHNSTVSSYQASASATTMDKRAEKGRLKRAAPRQDIVLPYSRLVVEIATLSLPLSPSLLSPRYYCIAYLIRYAF